MLASAASDGSVRMWNATTGRHLATLFGHTHAHHSFGLSVAFSPDGNMMASGDFDKTVRLWDVATRTNTATLKHFNPVNSVVFSPDGNMLAAGTSGNDVRLWDVATRATIAMLRHDKYLHPRFDHHYWVYSVAFSPDGNMLASGGENGIVKLWDVATGASTATLDGHSYRVRAVAFSPDGNMLASAASDSTIWLWDVTTGATITTLLGHTGNVNSLAFSPDGNMLASGASDNSIRLWYATTGAIITMLSGHTDEVHSVAFSPDGNMLVSGGKDGYINMWDVSDIAIRAREIPATLQLHGNYPNPFNPSTRVVFDLPSEAEVTVHVFDVLGRNVIATSPVSLSRGWGHSLEVNASSLPSGVYVYQVRAQAGSDMLVRSGRMVLAK